MSLPARRLRQHRTGVSARQRRRPCHAPMTSHQDTAPRCSTRRSGGGESRARRGAEEIALSTGRDRRCGGRAMPASRSTLQFCLYFTPSTPPSGTGNRKLLRRARSHPASAGAPEVIVPATNEPPATCATTRAGAASREAGREGGRGDRRPQNLIHVGPAVPRIRGATGDTIEPKKPGVEITVRCGGRFRRLGRDRKNWRRLALDASSTDAARLLRAARIFYATCSARQRSRADRGRRRRRPGARWAATPARRDRARRRLGLPEDRGRGAGAGVILGATSRRLDASAASSSQGAGAVTVARASV